MFPSFSFSRFVACFAVVQVLCCLTHHALDLHHLDEICVPHPCFLVHVVHHLLLARDVLHLNLVFVRTCRRVFPVCVFHRDSNLNHASRNRILVHLALALPLELIHTVGFQLFAVSLSFDVSSSDSQHGFGRRICSISFLRAVSSSTICDVTSSSVHCTAHFPSLLALALVIFLICC